MRGEPSDFEFPILFQNLLQGGRFNPARLSKTGNTSNCMKTVGGGFKSTRYGGGRETFISEEGPGRETSIQKGVEHQRA